MPFPETEGRRRHVLRQSRTRFRRSISWRPGATAACRRTAASTPRSRTPSTPTGLYLYDAFGNLNLLYRDPAIASMCPIPVRPRPRPPVYHRGRPCDGPQEGRFLRAGRLRRADGRSAGHGASGCASWRAAQDPAAHEPAQPRRFGRRPGQVRPGHRAGREPTARPISACRRACPYCSRPWTTRAWRSRRCGPLTYVQPEQTLSCVGCHESREAAPRPAETPLAAVRGPSKLTPGPEGSWPLRFDRLVQPVLDRTCVSCHRPQSKVATAAPFDLTPPTFLRQPAGLRPARPAATGQ